MFQYGQRIFKPTLIPTLVTLILLPCMIWLGFWQLDRAEEKRGLLKDFEMNQKQPAVNMASITNPEQLVQYQKIEMQGMFDVQHQFLLDNKVYQGKAGYHVITPFKLSGSNKAILINRGWLPQGLSRQDLPMIPTPKHAVTLSGQIKLNPGEGFNLGGDMNENSGWPRVVQNVEPDLLADYLGYPVLSLLVLQDAASEAGFVRDWYIKKIVPEKSTSYAVQWFALSIALVIIYLGVNFRKISTGKNHVA